MSGDGDPRQSPHLIPLAVTSGSEGFGVEWLDAAGFTFDDPMFHMTVKRALDRATAPLIVRTDLQHLFQRQQSCPGVPLAGLVFHVSRCGSTLVSNLLGSSERNVVMSEPAVFNQVLLETLKRPLDYPRVVVVGLLRALASASAARRTGKEERLFIKLTSWNTLLLPLLREAFPGAKVMFVYRNPLEVLVSNLRQPFQAWLWDEAISGTPLREAVHGTPVQLVSRVIARQLRAMLDHADPATWLLDYSELGPDLPDRVAAFFGLDPSEEERRAMTECLGRSAKDPSRQERFSDDSAGKRAWATEAMAAALRAEVGDVYERLEALRAARAPGRV
jgi:hypothetical protein